MQGLKNMLLQEQSRLEEIVLKAKEEISNSPDGYLRISKDNKRARYYHCTNSKIGDYIEKGNEQLPRQLAQKSYNRLIVKQAQKRLVQLSELLLDFNDDEIEQIYHDLSDDRKELVIPIEPTKQQQLKIWLETPYRGKEFLEGSMIILSERGERVRSKSEKILADYFYRNGIQYLYEKPLYLNGFGTVYPDFTFFSQRLGKEIYWEHEGMMDKADYAQSAIKKINSYQLNGIFPGERFILTYETEKDALNTKMIKTLVTKYLSV